jgi:alginate O-acetyltransferase complex protein AlgI
MIFTTVEFLMFFLAVVIGQRLILNFRFEKFFLLVASYFFYMSWNVACGGLILFTSSVDYFVGGRLATMKHPTHRKWLLAASLTTNLGVLAFFKYANFILVNTHSLLNWLGIEISLGALNIILPVGISFFTFQSMSYTIDVYRGHLPPCRRLPDFLLFVSFFPQLVAGPIVRAADLLPQFNERKRATAEDIETGIAHFLLGAVKKTVISDQIAGHVDLIFSNPASYDAPTLLLGVLGYAVQIYCDFSGYSDMAIGTARILGYRFGANFQMPYSAASITEFWRRWHISLSTWLRDYLYISLGGNRQGRWRTYRNLMITMLLGGLWHGASWNFILWGALHGGALAVHRVWQESRANVWMDQQVIRRWLGRIIGHGLTLGVVLIGWILFRAQTFDGAWEYLNRIFTWSSDGARLGSPFILPMVFAVAIVHLITPKDYDWAEQTPRRSVPTRIAAYTMLLLLIICLGATDAAPFIYFQF